MNWHNRFKEMKSGLGLTNSEIKFPKATNVDWNKFIEPKQQVTTTKGKYTIAELKPLK
jgi:hypothetical protein